MRESIPERYSRWRLDELLLKHVGLRIAPSTDDGLALAGCLAFRVTGPDEIEIEDSYEVKLLIPVEFPKFLAIARETSGRIPRQFHKLDDGSLCLGAPTEVRLKLASSPTLITLVDEILIPYLFGYSYYSRNGKMPYGELEHGVDGLLQQFATLFGTTSRTAAYEFVYLSSLRRRFANKYLCPCGSGRRLGRCHNLKVNAIRSKLGHKWFQQELAVIEQSLTLQGRQSVQ